MISRHLLFSQLFTNDTQSGLTRACLTSDHPLPVVSDAVLRYVKKWIPTQRAGVLAGNSVHIDKSFLAQEMPELVDWLHYRLFF